MGRKREYYADFTRKSIVLGKLRTFAIARFSYSECDVLLSPPYDMEGQELMIKKIGG